MHFVLTFYMDFLFATGPLDNDYQPQATSAQCASCRNQWILETATNMLPDGWHNIRLAAISINKCYKQIMGIQLCRSVSNLRWITSKSKVQKMRERFGDACSRITYEVRLHILIGRSYKLQAHSMHAIWWNLLELFWTNIRSSSYQKMESLMVTYKDAECKTNLCISNLLYLVTWLLVQDLLCKSYTKL